MIPTTNRVVSFDSESLEADLGLSILTAESCAYALRLLCDLNETGVAFLTEYLGAKPVGQNWNGYVAGDPAVASIMLPRPALLPLWLEAFKTAKVIVTKNPYISATAFRNVEAEELRFWTRGVVEVPRFTAFDMTKRDAFYAATGIYVLDGEPTPRQAVRLNAAGKETVSEFFGGLEFQGDDMFLPTDCLTEIFVYTMLRCGMPAVIRVQDALHPAAIVVTEPGEAAIQTAAAPIEAKVGCVHRNRQSGGPTIDGRNVHAFSGRAA